MKVGTRTWQRQPLWLYALWVGALGLFALAVRNIPFQDLFEAFANLQPAALLILGGLNLAVIFLLAGRWWLILRAQGQTRSLAQLTGYRVAAFSIAYFTPGPQFGGEPLQVHLLRSREGVSSANAIASVSLDRLIELIANFSFLACGLFVLLQSGLLGNLPFGQALALTLVLLCIPILYLAALAKDKKPVAGILARFENRPKWHAAGRVVEETEHLVGIFCRQKPLALLSTIAVSMLAWVLMVAEYALLLNYLGFTVSLPQAIIALTAARLAFIVPTPGGLGAFEASQVLAAEALGFSPLSGLTISLIIRGRDLLVAGAGLWLSAIYMKQSPNQVHVVPVTEEE